MGTQTFGVLPSFALYAVTAAIGLALLALTKNHRNEMRIQVLLFLAAFTIRFGFALTLYEFGLLPQLQEPDATGWVQGLSLARRWTRDGVGLLDLPVAMIPAFDASRGYPYLLGLFFHLTRFVDRLPAAALNCLFGALMVVFAYRATRLLFSKPVAVRVGVLTCVFPSMIVWSAQTLKEPVVVLLETVAVYALVALRRRGFRLRHAVLCATTIVLLLMFRFYAAYAAAAVAGLTFLWPQATKGKTGIASAITVLALTVPLLVVSGTLARQEAQLSQFDLDFVERFRDNVAKGQASGVDFDHDLNTPTGFAMALVVGSAHLALAPFPWQLATGSSRMLIAAPELFIWWWLFFVGVVPGLAYCIRHRFTDVLPLIAFVAGMGLLYSLMFGNIGLVYRQRAQLLPWLFIFAAVGLDLRARRKLELRRAYQEAIRHRSSIGQSPAMGRGY